eukprot:UN02286
MSSFGTARNESVFNRIMETLSNAKPSAGDLKKAKQLQIIANDLVKKARDAEIHAERYGDLRHHDIGDLTLNDRKFFRSITAVYRVEQKGEKHYPDQFAIGYGVARIQRGLLSAVKHEHFDSNIAKMIAEFAATNIHVMVQPKAIIFKDRKMRLDNEATPGHHINTSKPLDSRKSFARGFESIPHFNAN